MKRWRTVLDYPIVAITDIHGQRSFLERLLDRLEERPEWPECSVVFVGDYVDRGPDVQGTIDLILDLARQRKPPVTAVMGNHDLALTRAARLDDGPPSSYWVERYQEAYDHDATFRSYLGRNPRHGAWEQDLFALRDAMPAAHRQFLKALPWLVEAPGHLFLHCGLSPELEETADEQIEALRDRRWDDSLRPVAGTKTADLWQLEYSVWLGADRRLAAAPLPAPGRVQVTGHKPISSPDISAVRIRLDTSGGFLEPLTACLLVGPGKPPVFVRSDGGP